MRELLGYAEPHQLRYPRAVLLEPVQVTSRTGNIARTASRTISISRKVQNPIGKIRRLNIRRWTDAHVHAVGIELACRGEVSSAVHIEAPVTTTAGHRIFVPQTDASGKALVHFAPARIDVTHPLL